MMEKKLASLFMRHLIILCGDELQVYPAFNVTARFEGDVGIMIMDQDKQPFEELEARKSYELVLIAHNGSASKFRIITEWTDANGERQLAVWQRERAQA